MYAWRFRFTVPSVRPWSRCDRWRGSRLSELEEISRRRCSRRIRVECRFISSMESRSPKPASVYSMDPARDREKFAFFSMAALEMIHHIDWKPDIIHANDWHTALAVYALRFPSY